MDAREVLNHARDAMTVKRVFGDPYEQDGLTVIPVATVMGGAGARWRHRALEPSRQAPTTQGSRSAPETPGTGWGTA